MSSSANITPPIEPQCTLLQACEYITFGWEPRTKANEQLCPPMKYVRSHNYAFLTHGDAFGSPIITAPDNNPYNWGMLKALDVLYDLIKSGTITPMHCGPRLARLDRILHCDEPKHPQTKKL